METEPLKLLGRLNGSKIQYANFDISAQTNRVPIVDGHLAALSLKLGREVELEEVIEAFETYRAPQAVRGLPSTPEKPVIYRPEPDRPQPRRDRGAGNGMSITVGRVLPCRVFDVKLLSLVHNTLRGAAGGAIQNAEWLLVSGYLGEEAKASVLAGELAL